MKEKLDELNFISYVKTSGKKGLHVVLPVIKSYNFKQTREFVHPFRKFLARGSDLVVSEFRSSRAWNCLYRLPAEYPGKDHDSSL